jgi:hypothetical protein
MAPFVIQSPHLRRTLPFARKAGNDFGGILNRPDTIPFQMEADEMCGAWIAKVMI